MLWIQRFSLLPSSSCPKGRRMARRPFRSQRPSPTPPWTQRIWPPTTQAKGNLKKDCTLEMATDWYFYDLDDSGWFWMILALETRSVIIVCWNPSFTPPKNPWFLPSDSAKNWQLLIESYEVGFAGWTGKSGMSGWKFYKTSHWSNAFCRRS